MTHSHTLEFEDSRATSLVYGNQDNNLKALSRLLDVQISARSGRVHIDANNPETLQVAINVLQQMYQLTLTGFRFHPRDVEHAFHILDAEPDTELSSIFLDTVLTTQRGKDITPKGLAQKHYVDAIRAHDVVFGIGPAGTGKTYLAMAMAVEALLSKRVQRLILTRPAVEAGEKLGFLPGDLVEKVNPYVRPLYDALYDMIGNERAGQLIEKGLIEVAPLAFMRGRTLNNSFVILDEAQNTTKAQMKMLLTRLGFDSKAVITGDITQIDLERDSSSGLVDAQRILNNVRGISFCRFSQIDVVRHPLVMRIILAYERNQQRKEHARRQAKSNTKGD